MESGKNPKYKARPGRPRKLRPDELGAVDIRVSLYQLIILYLHVVRAQKHPEIGHQDERAPWSKYLNYLNSTKISIPIQDFENAFWASNMLDDMVTERFWHPQEKSIKQFFEEIGNSQRAFLLDYDYKHHTVDTLKKPGVAAVVSDEGEDVDHGDDL